MKNAKIIESIKLFTKVEPEGEKVVGVAVKLSETIIEDGLVKDTLTVKAETFHGESTQLEWRKRTISELYVHHSPELTVTPSNIGNYIIIKLDENESNAGALNFDQTSGLNAPAPYQIILRKELLTEKGDRIKPSGEVYEPLGSITPIVDAFGKYEISHEDFTMNYRLFEPETEEGEKYPLVIFLHGAGERGYDNELQLRGNRGALTWAEPDFQRKHPSFVVAPQVKPGGWWTNDSEIKTVITLIEKLIENYPIDENRVYITGVSMGGFGTWNLLRTRPDLFAAALPICGGLSLTETPDYVLYAEIIKHIPIWTTHSEDDDVVDIEKTTNKIIHAMEVAGEVVIRGAYAGNLSRGDNNAAAQKLWKIATQMSSHILFTTYIDGTTPVNAHWSWVPTYENNVMKEWLFAQVKHDN